MRSDGGIGGIIGTWPDGLSFSFLFIRTYLGWDYRVYTVGRAGLGPSREDPLGWIWMGGNGTALPSTCMGLHDGLHGLGWLLEGIHYSGGISWLSCPSFNFSLSSFI